VPRHWYFLAALCSFATSACHDLTIAPYCERFPDDPGCANGSDAADDGAASETSLADVAVSADVDGAADASAYGDSDGALEDTSPDATIDATADAGSADAPPDAPSLETDVDAATEATVDAHSNEVASDAAVDTPDTISPVCSAGASFCVGAELRRCAADGLSSTAVATCGSAALCVPGNAACTAPACPIGATYCVGAELRRCSADGTSSSSVATCASSALCVPGAAGCTPPTCMTGATQCSGSALQKCNADRTGWTTTRICGGPACTPTGCVDALQVSLGLGFMVEPHSCALLSDATVRCWGNNAAGQLGDATKINRNRPVNVPLSGLAKQISVGSTHSCAVIAGGSLQCWGSNAVGALGDGTTVSSSVPVDVRATWVVEVAVGDGYTCARASDGSVACWGLNSSGQLGDGTHDDRATPADISHATFPKPVVQITAGEAHACARMSDGRVLCWGDNSSGQLGDASGVSSASPVFVVGIDNAIDVAAGAVDTCALLADGGMKCWGGNTLGQLGDGTMIDSSSPVTVTAVSGVTGLMTGVWSALECGVKTDHSIACWSSISSDAAFLTAPAKVAQIAGTHGYACVRLLDGGVSCYGSNAVGQLGNGTTTDATTFVPVLW
jgi:hypothetical protein